MDLRSPGIPPDNRARRVSVLSPFTASAQFSLIACECALDLKLRSEYLVFQASSTRPRHPTSAAGEPTFQDGGARGRPARSYRYVQTPFVSCSNQN